MAIVQAVLTGILRHRKAGESADAREQAIVRQRDRRLRYGLLGVFEPDGAAYYATPAIRPPY